MNVVIDDLSYGYNANQLKSVSDAGTTDGFTNGASTTDEYGYDANGNLIRDDNKGITGITYNHLNLPEVITLSGGTITFLYDANGNKLRKTVSGSSQDYLGGIEYSGGAIEAIYHEEGRATPSGTTWQYEYYLKDHLGNTRVIFTDNNDDGTPEIIQEADYYPFGMRHDRSMTATNHYLYNGKELNTDLGLDWYDYGARWLDVETGRWSTIDPLAENYASMSPFNYVANNPIRNIDTDGRFIIFGNKSQKREMRKMIRIFRKVVRGWSREQWEKALEISAFNDPKQTFKGNKRRFMKLFARNSGPQLRFANTTKLNIGKDENGDDEIVNLMSSDGSGNFDSHSAYATTHNVPNGEWHVTFDKKIYEILRDYRMSKKEGTPMNSFSGPGYIPKSHMRAFMRAENIGVERFIIAVFGHEIAHLGARVNFADDPEGGPGHPDERGFRMEREVLGGIIGYQNWEVGYGVYDKYFHYSNRQGSRDAERKEGLMERRNTLYPHLLKKR